MIFWISAAVLTFVAALCVVLPLAARSKQLPSSMDFDKAIYKARLLEIEKDEELGRITSDAAKLAKADEGRKLIALSDSASDKVQKGSGIRWGIKLALIAGLLVLPAASLATYLSIGNPQLPDQSLASRLSVQPEDQSVVELVSRAEAHLSKNPNDARGWAVLAPVYSRLQRYQDAMNAWGNVFRLAPETPEIKATFAESILAVSQGVVTAEAKQLFQQELRENNSSAKARFYLAMALGQEGKHAEAVEAWQELIRGGTDASPWMQAAKKFLSDSAQAANITLAEQDTTAPGPSAEQIEASKDMTGEDRNAMILGMVSGLAERLKEDPSDQAGWQRLIRAYQVLGEKDKALEAITTAKAAHLDDQNFVAELEDTRQLLE